MREGDTQREIQNREKREGEKEKERDIDDGGWQQGGGRGTEVRESGSDDCRRRLNTGWEEDKAMCDEELGLDWLWRRMWRSTARARWFDLIRRLGCGCERKEEEDEYRERRRRWLAVVRAMLGGSAE